MHASMLNIAVAVTVVTASSWAVVSSGAGRLFKGARCGALRQRLGGALTIGASVLLAVVEP